MNIVVSGNYGAGNLGDEMILEGLIHLINNSTKKAQITILSGDPKGTKKDHKTPSVHKFPAGLRSSIHFIKEGQKTKEAMKKADYFILGGGGLFNELSKKASFIWTRQLKQAFKRKIPVLMIGQSIGEIQGKSIRKTLKKAFNKSKLIVVRDYESKRRLQSWGITQNIHVYSDLALKIAKKDSKIPKQEQITICPRQIKGHEDQYSQLLSELIKKIKKNTPQKNFELINFQTKGSERDSILSQKIIDKSQQAKIHYIPNPSTRKAQSTIKHSGFIIGTRLHSIITAINNQKPFLAISYSEKVYDLLKDLGMEWASVKIEDLTVEKLYKKYCELSEPRKFQNIYKTILKEQNTERISLQELLKDTLENPNDF